MQRAVNTLTDRIFPGVSIFNEDGRSQLSVHRVMGAELASNLPLQMALYFNVFYFPFWLVVSVVMLDLKFDHLHPLYRIILVAILIVVTVIEIVRLYLGYLGNLSEMIPELAGFWLLTLLLQLPLQAFLLLNEDAVILPLERSVNMVMTSFILFELVVGYRAIRKVSKQLTIKFRLETFDLDAARRLSS